MEPGPNPDVEIPRVLADRGYEHVLPPIAELRRDDMDLAVLRDFLVGATEGWQLARASVRDVLASRLPPEESGGDFAADSARLGSVIAELHLAMADEWGSEAGDPAAWVDGMLGAVDEVAAGRRSAAVARPRRGAGPAARRPDGIDDAGAEICIHGDLHLSQVIQMDGGWLVLDFEGEPARRRDDRYTRSSPLRDVAGMLRSFHYAAATGLAEWDQGDAELLTLLDAWEQRNRDAFLTAYFAEDGHRRAAPGRPDRPHRAAHRLRARQGGVRARLRARPPTRPRVDPAGGHRPARRPSRALVTDVRRARGRADRASTCTCSGRASHERLWDVLGAHVVRRRHHASRCGRRTPARCRWSGQFNGWDRAACPLERVDAGVWTGFVAGIGTRTPYKYAITGADGRTIDRADPMAQFAEHSGGMASIVFESQHEWQDGDWMGRRGGGDPVARPHEHLRGAPRVVAAPRRRPACCRTASWRRRSPTTSRRSGSPTWS